VSETIVVVGSLNMDLVVEVPRLPRPGETVLGRRHFSNPGGKGANQAVAAARLGGDVAMVGRVGDDEPGEQLLDALAADDVDVERVLRTNTATGLAVITVDDDAENAIVVSSGANAEVAADDVAGAVEDAAVCLLQLEIPDEPVVAAARRCRGQVLLNPAPARDLTSDLLDAVDVLIPNQHELAELAGVATVDDADTAAEAVGRLGFAGTTVVTMGAAGAVIVTRDGEVRHVGAPRVDAVDSTAAGDAFCGALAQALTAGVEMTDAVRWACGAGAAAATRHGAQASLPTAGDVSDLLD
jgi:ribokinase